MPLLATAESLCSSAHQRGETYSFDARSGNSPLAGQLYSKRTPRWGTVELGISFMRREGGAANEWAGDRGWQLGDFLALFDRGRRSWGKGLAGAGKSLRLRGPYLRSEGIQKMSSQISHDWTPPGEELVAGWRTPYVRKRGWFLPAIRWAKGFVSSFCCHTSLALRTDSSASLVFQTFCRLSQSARGEV